MQLPDENIYGHTKKLKFILDEILNYINCNHENKIIRVLDFGCGNGSAISKYIINLNEKIEYVGIDFHEESISYANKFFSNNRARFLEEIPKEKEFDILIYSDVIEHLYNPKEMLLSHVDLLKENGIMIGSIPNGFGPFENEKRIDNFLRISKAITMLKKMIKILIGYKSKENMSSIPYNSESGHVQFFTKNGLINVLENSGYSVDKFKNTSFIGAPLSERLLNFSIFIKMNTKIADYLPTWTVSGWLFVCKKK